MALKIGTEVEVGGKTFRVHRRSGRFPEWYLVDVDKDCYGSGLYPSQETEVFLFDFRSGDGKSKNSKRYFMLDTSGDTGRALEISEMTSSIMRFVRQQRETENQLALLLNDREPEERTAFDLVNS